MHIYIGKLTSKTSSEDLKALFSKYGNVDSANVYQDRFREGSEMLGFVEMPDEEEAKEAVAKLNGKEIKGSKIDVHYARNKERDRRLGGERRTDSDRREK